MVKKQNFTILKKKVENKTINDLNKITATNKDINILIRMYIEYINKKHFKKNYISEKEYTGANFINAMATKHIYNYVNKLITKSLSKFSNIFKILGRKDKGYTIYDATYLKNHTIRFKSKNDYTIDDLNLFFIGKISKKITKKGYTYTAKLPKEWLTEDILHKYVDL